MDTAQAERGGEDLRSKLDLIVYLMCSSLGGKTKISERKGGGKREKLSVNILLSHLFRGIGGAPSGFPGIKWGGAKERGKNFWWYNPARTSFSSVSKKTRSPDVFVLFLSRSFERNPKGWGRPKGQGPGQDALLLLPPALFVDTERSAEESRGERDYGTLRSL